MKLKPDELAVLDALDSGDADFGFFCFAGLIERTGLERRRVRLACRSLARRGLAAYSRGLWDCRGYPAGAGYAITAQGRAVVCQKPAAAIVVPGGEKNAPAGL